MTPAATTQDTILLGPFYTRHEAAHRAQLSAAELIERDGLIRLAGRFSVEEAYFAFQFDVGGIRPDVAAAVTHLEQQLDPCRAADWLARPHPELAGRAPLEWLRSGGRLDMVLGLIGALEEGSPAK